MMIAHIGGIGDDRIMQLLVVERELTIFASKSQHQIFYGSGDNLRLFRLTGLAINKFVHNISSFADDKVGGTCKWRPMPALCWSLAFAGRFCHHIWRKGFNAGLEFA